MPTAVAKKRAVARKKLLEKKKVFIPDLYIEDAEDPRKKLFEAYYTNPDSPTFSNALRSALKAGFTESYGRNILNQRPKWVSDILDSNEAKKLALQARKNLEEDLQMNIVEQAMGSFGPIFTADANGKKTVPVMVRNSKMMEIRQKATFFVSEKVDSLFNKTNKEEKGANQVVFNQTVIMMPDGYQVPYREANGETIPGVPEIN